MKSNTDIALSADEAKRLLSSPPIRRLVGRNRTKADVTLHRHDDRILAIKDYAPRPWLVRQTLGRWLVRREVAAYRAAGAAPGLVRFLGRFGPFALATEWVDARPLAGHEPRQLPAGWSERLRAIVGRLHERGVALGDLHHRDVLVAENGGVWVVDLATAWVLGPHPGPVRRWIFRRLRDQDSVALARIEARFRGADVDAAVEAVGAEAAAWHRRGRRLKRWLDRLRGRRR